MYNKNFLVKLLHPSLCSLWSLSVTIRFFNLARVVSFRVNESPEIQGTVFVFALCQLSYSNALIAHFRLGSNQRPRLYQRTTVKVAVCAFINYGNIITLFLPYGPCIIKKFSVFAVLRSIHIFVIFFGNFFPE